MMATRIFHSVRSFRRTGGVTSAWGWVSGEAQRGQTCQSGSTGAPHRPQAAWSLAPQRGQTTYDSVTSAPQLGQVQSALGLRTKR